MNESVPDWDTLRMLLAIGEAGSLRQAATQLRLSQPTLGRRVQELEQSLGCAVITRHARGVDLTVEGQALVEQARQIADNLTDFRRRLDGRESQVRGRVRLSCTEPVAMEVLPRSFQHLRRQHPALHIDVVVNNRASDVERREADVAIRMFQPRQAALVAKRVGASFTAFYASPTYLEAHGRPQTRQDLVWHEVIGPDRDPLFLEAAAALGFGPDAMAFRTDSFALTHAWTRAGIAIGALLGAVGARDPGLVQLLEPLNTYPVWLVTHPDLFGSAAIRAVWDRLAEDLPGWMVPPDPPGSISVSAGSSGTG